MDYIKLLLPIIILLAICIGGMCIKLFTRKKEVRLGGCQLSFKEGGCSFCENKDTSCKIEKNK